MNLDATHLDDASFADAEMERLAHANGLFKG